jgi:hypothetical protein
LSTGKFESIQQKKRKAAVVFDPTAIQNNEWGSSSALRGKYLALRNFHDAGKLTSSARINEHASKRDHEGVDK